MFGRRIPGQIPTFRQAQDLKFEAQRLLEETQKQIEALQKHNLQLQQEVARMNLNPDEKDAQIAKIKSRMNRMGRLLNKIKDSSSPAQSRVSLRAH